MRALQSTTDHVVFQFRYNQIYQVKTTIGSIQLSNFNDSKKIKANPSTLVYQVEVQDQINMQELKNRVK